MITKSYRHLLAGVALVAGIVSCADGPTAPRQASPANTDPAHGLIGSLLGTLTSLTGIIGEPVDSSVYVLRRTTPLAEPITVSKSIGYSGGTISIPEAGLTVTFPRGAVSSSTLITVTAVAGDKVAYEFGPHGLSFQQAVSVRQSLDGTYAVNANPKYEAVYYGASSDGLVSKLVNVVLEVLKAVVDPVTNSVSFNVRHFSGYLVSTGRTAGGE